jgi:nitrogen regulatory protein PII 1
MLLVRAIVRPEKKDDVLAGLSAAGFNAATMVDVVGRGKQKGIRIGGMVYDEIPKVLILVVIPDEDKEKVVKIVLSAARSGTGGTFGDGKIFVSPVEEAYTISKNAPGL